MLLSFKIILESKVFCGFQIFQSKKFKNMVTLPVGNVMFNSDSKFVVKIGEDSPHHFWRIRSL